jgi:hypothetical protein
MDESAEIDCTCIRDIRNYLKASRKSVDNLKFQLNRTGAGVREADRVSCESLWRVIMEESRVRRSLIARCSQESAKVVEAMEQQLQQGLAKESEVHKARQHSRLIKDEDKTEDSLVHLCEVEFRKACRKEFLRFLEESKAATP